MYGVIDIGSNTIRLVVYRLRADGRLKRMMNKKYVVGLAGYVDADNNLTGEGLDQAVDALLELKLLLESIRLKKLYVFATASLRNVIHSEDAVEEIRRRTGFDVQILSGEDEARYGYYGLLQEQNTGSGLVVDVGGGSTELTAFADHRILCSRSLPMGSLNLYMKYVGKIFPDRAETEQIEREICQRLSGIKLPEQASGALICCEGGSARAACKLIRARYKDAVTVDTYDPKYLKKFLNDFRKEKKEQMHLILKTVPDRVHTILPGMLILKNIAAQYGCKRMITVSGGVREGYLLAQLQRDGILSENSIGQEAEDVR